jgi:hypothetical protein
VQIDFCRRDVAVAEHPLQLVDLELADRLPPEGLGQVMKLGGHACRFLVEPHAPRTFVHPPCRRRAYRAGLGWCSSRQVDDSRRDHHTHIASLWV